MKYLAHCCVVLFVTILAPYLTVAQDAKDVRRSCYLDALFRDSFQVLDDEELTAHVNEIGQKIVAASGNPRGYQFRFFIVNDATPNAFTVGGGYVYVTTGLLRIIESEDELAVILGHEVGHNNERHVMRTGMGSKAAIFWTVFLTAASQAASIYAGDVMLKNLPSELYNPGGQLLVTMVGNAASMITSDVGQAVLATVYKGRSESEEFKSDELGVRYAHKANYKVEAFETVFDRLRKLSNAEMPGQSISRLHSSPEMLDKRMKKVKEITMKLSRR